MANFKQKDFEIIRGTTPRMRFEFNKKLTMGDGSIVKEPLVFDDARFTVWKGKKGGELLFRYSIATGEITLTDPSIGQVEFMWQSDDSRALQETPIGAEGKNRYELELRDGIRENVFILGSIAGVGGINDDEQQDDGGIS